MTPAITAWVDRHHTRAASVAYQGGSFSAFAHECGVCGYCLAADTADAAFAAAREDLGRIQDEAGRELKAILERQALESASSTELPAHDHDRAPDGEAAE